MRSSMSSAAMAYAIFFSAATSSSPSSIASAFHYSAISLSAGNHNTAAAACKSSTTQLDAAGSQFSELDKLRAKRLSLRRPSPPAAVDDVDTRCDDRVVDTTSEQQLEYLYDRTEERHDDDFFHVILMPSTFSKKQVSIEQATTSLLSTLSTTKLSTANQLTYEKAHNLSLFAKHQGFSVIGTWTREDCLSIGEELVKEGLDCRVIPYNSALPSSSSLASSRESVREEKVGSDGVVSSSTSSFSSDYLLSLSSR